MAEFKLTINDPKTGKSYKKVLESDLFKNKKINQSIKGDDFGFKDYEFEITGGSDNAGFPMRKDLEGILRKKAFLSKGVGMQNKRKGLKLRKTICGNSINDNISQINLKIKKSGAKKIDEILKVKKEGEEKPIEEKKVEEKLKEVNGNKVSETPKNEDSSIEKKKVVEKKEEKEILKEEKKVEVKEEKTGEVSKEEKKDEI